MLSVRRFAASDYPFLSLSFSFNKTVLPVVCDGLHFIHMWKALAWPHHFSKNGGGLGLKFIAFHLDIFTSLMSSDLNSEPFQLTIFGNFVD